MCSRSSRSQPKQERADMPKLVNRRQYMREVGASTILGAIAIGGAHSVFAESSSQPVRIGVVGLGPRGLELLRMLLAAFPEVSVPALCELKPKPLEVGVRLVKELRGTTPAGYCQGEYEYRKMFERDD